MAELSPIQRNMMFAQATRQNLQTLPSQTVTPGGNLSIELPKTRLLSHVYLLFKGTLTAAHASETAFVPKAFAPFNLIKQARVEVNNGFNPFKVSGIGLYLYNRLQRNASRMPAVSTANGRNRTLLETVASSGGTANDIRFVVELPITLNKRDPVGLINLQNPTTVVTINLDFNALTELLNVTTGFTLTSSIQVTPVVETFSIPVLKDAVPDLSVLKLVNEYNQGIAGSGDVTYKLPVGTTYRRLIAYVTDSSGGVADSALGDFEINLNQADTPYKVNPFALAAMNEGAYGDKLEAGVYVLDFSDQGIPGYGGSRDYVDTERLTEYWLKTTASAAGNIMIVAETLARLSQG